MKEMHNQTNGRCKLFQFDMHGSLLQREAAVRDLAEFLKLPKASNFGDSASNGSLKRERCIENRLENWKPINKTEDDKAATALPDKFNKLFIKNRRFMEHMDEFGWLPFNL